jgi:type III pantothenate kinase
MAAAPRHLLIDISNSFTKFTFATPEKLGRIHKIATSELSSAVLEAAGKADRIVLSCVVPKAEKRLAPFLKKHHVLRVGPELKLGVGIDYPHPESIGGDRLANAASATTIYGGPCVVVDFGTAVTFDIISRDRKYLGGVIAPGLEAMTDYLHRRTALLPKIELTEPVSAIGKSTHDAMLAGAVFGYRGLIRQILEEIRRDLGKPRNLKIVATGGYAELIAAKMPEIQTVHPGLTLEGLRIIGTLNR